MDVFRLRDSIIKDYSHYIGSFIQISDDRIRQIVDHELNVGLLWPDPLLQLNPAFAWGGWIDDLITQGILAPECSKIFRGDKSEQDGTGRPMRLYQHQVDAIEAARTGDNYVLTTGTGSGKSLSYIVPIVDYVLRHGSGHGIKAIIVYPMNALANSQELELKKFLCHGYGDKPPVTFRRYTGQEGELARQDILDNPPDILLTNYVMLELILTRPFEKKLVEAALGLQFLVFDELHTYRGRQGADVGMLIRRLRNTITPSGTTSPLQCIGTSATLAGPGTFAEQQREVALVASKLFGAEVMPHRVIVETLRKETECADFGSPRFLSTLRDRALQYANNPPTDYATFIQDPLSVWIENSLGLEEKEGLLIRCKPRSLSGQNGAAQLLSEATGLDVEACIQPIQDALLAGYKLKNPDTGKPPFAFKLHQFLSKGDTVYATPEPESTRTITLHGQQYAPDKEERTVLFPLQFCRECGQEYYSVWRINDPSTQETKFSARNPSQAILADGYAGYLYISESNPWPSDPQLQAERLPDDWTEDKDGKLYPLKSKEKYLPEKVYVSKDGTFFPAASPEATPAWFVATPFTFCHRCRVSYTPRISDFTKLATLGTEGRSTATTVLSMSTVRHLRQETELSPIARKLLCFTDNRQDASLQAGHFNDFIEIGLVRSALFNALEQSGSAGLEHDVLPQKVFDALGLGFDKNIFPPDRYSVDPGAQYGKATNVRKAFWNVLGYRIYSDLRRGWRIVAPNLEQCGLLHIDYLDLDQICADEALWQGNPVLAAANPEKREEVSRLLLDFMRRRLALKVDYLKPEFQESIRQQSSQNLISPWKIDEDEKLHHAAIVFPRAKQKGHKEYGGDVFLSPRGTLGGWLRKAFPEWPDSIRMEDTGVLIASLFEALSNGGLVEPVLADSNNGQGFQIPASVMVWKAGNGLASQYDPLRMQHANEQGGRTNPFFVDLYRAAAKDGTNLEAKEHTAQVSSEEREKREQDFRDANLPILYCSPTMELGVDIAQLNAVSMRNVPPTPANYAQRSGRAGRSGQPALIITYCAQGSSHDQHFFRHPGLMVAGAVSTPRLDLANEDLIRAHVHAIWLSESGLDLKKSLRDLLDVTGDKPALSLLEGVVAHLADVPSKDRAMIRAKEILDGLANELQGCGWYAPTWLSEAMSKIERKFEDSCERWRSLYRAAVEQRDAQNLVINDASRSHKDRDQARRLRAEAEAQIELLLQSGSTFQSDFYSYRYFASEGFLPGYNFPRLPLSAFIPGRRGVRGRDEYIARPRFLAISEFGPGSFIYHEGSRYVISRVMIDVQEDEELGSGKVKQCMACGYVHPIALGDGVDNCEMCGERLPHALDNLFRMRNVSTRRRDRINSDEEERTKYGYTLRTGFRFAQHGGSSAYRLSEIIGQDGQRRATLKYGHGATLWRINMGWANKGERSAPGFLLDLDRGTWTKEGSGSADAELTEAGTGRTQRVIPYVEDRKNCLLFVPDIYLSTEAITSLQAALKQAIQREYQLEEFELSAETLPAGGEPLSILIYESAEGGAGVLRRLVDDPKAMGAVAREALRLCHFNPETGQDFGKAEHASEDCVVACYDCLMNYGNQRVHEKLNRHSIKDYLLSLSTAEVSSAPSAQTRTAHLDGLKKRCDSKLEQKWLDQLEVRGHALPSHAQYPIPECKTRPDFFYAKEQVAVYIDGPHHEYPERQARDQAQQNDMEDLGLTVIRFAAGEQWSPILDKYPHVFGRKK